MRRRAAEGSASPCRHRGYGRANASVRQGEFSGLILDALEHFGSDRLEDAAAGYRYFGLEGVADLLNEAKCTSKADDDLDLWEAELDGRYSAIVPDDSMLFTRFEMIVRLSPAEFAPI